MAQNPQKEKGPSLSANSSNYLLGTFRIPSKTPKDKDKLPFITTKLPPISPTAGLVQAHPIILAKPKFPHSSVHLNQVLSNRNQTQTTTKAETEPFEKEENSSKIKKTNLAISTNSSNTSALKNLQYSNGSLHLPSNSFRTQENDIQEIKKTIGIETSNDINNYNKIVKDLENIIDQSHHPGTIKNNRSNFFDLSFGSKTQMESKMKSSSPKRIQISSLTNKTPNKILTPLKIKTPGMNLDQNFAASLLFSPHQLLSPEYLPNIETSKSSSKKNGIVKAYAANTHQGLIRNYNEDRVAIILNIMKPANKKDMNWPLCSYFAIYDGHGGTKCAEFLRDNLHHYVVKDPNFPANPKMAIKKGFQLAEKNFLDSVQVKMGGISDKSGSCAIVVLIVGTSTNFLYSLKSKLKNYDKDQMCYVANVGDSRAVLSQEKGAKIMPLSKDHKPDQEEEKARILEAGGQVYQSQAQTMNFQGGSGPLSKTIQGPFRVLPGRLSVILALNCVKIGKKVSRTFGDAEAKLRAYGGNPEVIIAEPDIKSFKITDEHDFIMLGCDGIFDRLNNKEAMKALWETCSIHKYKNVHEFAARSIENLMREALLHKTLDNITSVMIAFKNLKTALFVSKKAEGKNSVPMNVDKNGNLIIDKMELIEYKYSPDNPNEASDEALIEKPEKQNENGGVGKIGKRNK